MQFFKPIVLGFVVYASSIGWATTSYDLLTTNLADSSPTPELSNFVQAVLDANPQLLAAQSSLNASNALQTAAAQPLYNPELSIEATDADVETRTLGISQSFDLGNKRAVRSSAARAENEAAAAEYLLTRQEITLELLQALAAHQTNTDLIALATERSRLLQDFSNISQQRFEVGDLSQTELNLAGLVAAQARVSKAVSAAGLSESTRTINSLVSRGSTQLLPALDFQLPPAATLDNTSSRLISLPEVQMAQKQVESASAVVELRNLERRPDPNIGVVWGSEGEENLIGLSFTIDLPIRNSRRSEVTAAGAQYQYARQTADSVLLAARAQLESSFEQYSIAWNAWADWERYGLPSLENQSNSLLQLGELGELSTSDFILQISQTIDSEESALSLRQTLWNAWFEWLAASGQIDQWIDTAPNRN